MVSDKAFVELMGKEPFTATAIALIIDGVRLPVYLVTQGPGIVGVWPLVAVGTAGVLVGTAAGTRVLARVPEATFRPVVSGLITALGITMLVAGR